MNDVDDNDDDDVKKAVLIKNEKHQFDSYLSEYKERLLNGNFNESVDNLFNYYSNEIEIRCESIKYDFEAMHKICLKKLKKFQKKLKSNQRTKNGSNHKIRKYENLLKQLINLNGNVLNSDSHIGLISSKYSININRYRVSGDSNCCSSKIVKFNTKLTSLNGICEIPSTSTPNSNDILLTDSNFNKLILIETTTYTIKQQIEHIPIQDCHQYEQSYHDQDKSYDQDQSAAVAVVSSFKFNYPCGLCIDTLYMTNVYVCNKFSSNIYILNRRLNRLKRIIGKKGTQPNEFTCPEDILYSTKSNCLFVLDTGNKRVQVFTRNGDYLKHYKLYSSSSMTSQCGGELLQYPIRFTLYDKDDVLAVCDTYEDVHIYNMFDDRLVTRQVIKANINNIDRVCCFISKYLVLCNNIGILQVYDVTSHQRINRDDDGDWKLLFENNKINRNLIGIISFMSFINNRIYLTFTNKRYLVVI